MGLTQIEDPFHQLNHLIMCRATRQRTREAYLLYGPAIPNVPYEVARKWLHERINQEMQYQFRLGHATEFYLRAYHKEKKRQQSEIEGK